MATSRRDLGEHAHDHGLHASQGRSESCRAHPHQERRTCSGYRRKSVAAVASAAVSQHPFARTLDEHRHQHANQGRSGHERLENADDDRCLQTPLMTRHWHHEAVQIPGCAHEPIHEQQATHSGSSCAWRSSVQASSGSIASTPKPAWSIANPAAQGPGKFDAAGAIDSQENIRLSPVGVSASRPMCFCSAIEAEPTAPPHKRADTHGMG